MFTSATTNDNYYWCDGFVYHYIHNAIKKAMSKATARSLLFFSFLLEITTNQTGWYTSNRSVAK